MTSQARAPLSIIERAFEISTYEAVVAIDVSSAIETCLNEMGAADGIVVVNVPHTTAALVLSEADDDLLRDIERFVREWPGGFEPFRHHRNDNPNAAAHLVSAFAGTQVHASVSAGVPTIGEHQRFVLIELDGPKQRTIETRLIGTTLEANEEKL